MRDAPGRWLLGVAVLLPVLIAVSLPQPFARGTMMFAAAIVLALLGGWLPGVIASVSSTLSLWYFLVPPTDSFRLASATDAASIGVYAVVITAMVVLVDVIARQERRAQAQVVVRDDTIAAIQHALLPTTTPTVRGAAIAWHYETGGTEAAPIGGDWIAFVPLAPTQLGMAIGDVAGHGRTAVRMMADYRFALRTIAVEQKYPGGVLTDIDRIVNTYNIEAFSTALYGILDLDERVWRFASAGHPPCLLARSGSAAVLDDVHGPPLGARARTAPYGETTVPLEDGDLLVLYTDGLVERRGEPLDDGIGRLCERVSELDDDADLASASVQLVQELAPSPADDVAIVLARMAF